MNKKFIKNKHFFKFETKIQVIDVFCFTKIKVKLKTFGWKMKSPFVTVWTMFLPFPAGTCVLLTQTTVNSFSLTKCKWTSTWSQLEKRERKQKFVEMWVFVHLSLRRSLETEIENGLTSKISRKKLNFCILANSKSHCGFIQQSIHFNVKKLKTQRYFIFLKVFCNLRARKSRKFLKVNLFCLSWSYWE